MQINWQKRIIWNVTLGEAVAFVTFYVFFGLAYLLTLAYSQLDYDQKPYFEVVWDYLPNQSIDYFLKMLFAIPFWLLYFKVLKNQSLFKRVMLHSLTAVVYVAVWVKSYYFLIESIGRNHIRGSGQAWDIYIPSLIYVIQFGIFHAYEYHRAHLDELQTNETLKRSLIQNELKALKAQLNPHFLYNTFNTISASVPPEQEKTREMIATLADMFRYQLRATKTEQVKLAEELSFIQQYLSLEKHRFGERLDVEFDIEDAVLNMSISPMLLQPLVENAIKHGLSSLIEGGKVTIIAKQQGAKVYFEVADTGIGMSDFEKVFEKGVGLTNVKKILEKMYHSHLNLTPNSPRGLRVSFVAP
jgi:two-component system, LytTR family, sensor kinase